ncbi:MAG: ATP-dependent helicase, partial [Nanohaloarchaea archaeon SW_7_46_7]
MKFSDLTISESTVSRLEENGITEPTEVQEKAIPEVLNGKDLLVESETGSGKTLAFSLPMIENLDHESSE